jgi:predicted RNA-binding Zn ribbon-like protein
VTQASAIAIPPATALLRDFVNTVEWQVDDESWTSPADLAAWLTENTGVTTTSITADDLTLARRIREGLRAVLLMHAGHDPLATSIADLNAAIGAVPLRMSFDALGAVSLESGQPLAVILAAIETARGDGSFERLKACSRDSCRWAYWDGSRNRSGRWCSMAGCGNYLKMRRRSGHRPDIDEVIDNATGGMRLPTLVDVAGRAGVSIKTVSNVVTGTAAVAEPTRSRVEAAIAELDYTPNLAARALRIGNPDAVDIEHDPYGLPSFPDEASLTAWTDRSDIATRTVRVFTCGPLTATLIRHPGVWDLIISDGRGNVDFAVMPPGEIARALHRIERR